MLNSSKAKPALESNNEFSHKLQNVKKIPRTILRTPPFSYILAKNKSAQRQVTGEFILLRGKNAMKPLKEIWKPIIIHKWQITRKVKIRCETSSNQKILAFWPKLTSSVSKIQEINVDFKWCDGITVEGMRALGLGIARNLTQLKNLTFTFLSCSKISDEEVIALVSVISTYLLGLRSLKLDFGKKYSQITDIGMRTLSKEIGRYLTNLTQFSISFDGCQGITDSGLNDFASNIGKRLAGLKNLALSFSLCRNITDKGVSALALGITKHLMCLNHLALSFELCDQLTDQALKTFSSSVGKNSVLKQLSLAFDECSQITNKGLYFVVKALKQLPQLKQLSLCFRGCSKITDESVKSLATELEKRLSQIQHLYLNFLFTSVTEKSKKMIKDMFTNRPSSNLMPLTNTSHLRPNNNGNMPNVEIL